MPTVTIRPVDNGYVVSIPGYKDSVFNQLQLVFDYITEKAKMYRAPL